MKKSTKNNHLENQLLLISSNFTPKTSHSCLKKKGTRTLGFPGINKKGELHQKTTILSTTLLRPPPTAYPQMPAMRPPAAPTAAPPTVAPSVAPTVPPAAVQPVQPLAPSQPAPSAPPVIPTVQAARWGIWWWMGWWWGVWWGEIFWRLEKS